jgi:hypothetical protein
LSSLNALKNEEEARACQAKGVGQQLNLKTMSREGREVGEGQKAQFFLTSLPLRSSRDTFLLNN